MVVFSCSFSPSFFLFVFSLFGFVFVFVFVLFFLSGDSSGDSKGVSSLRAQLFGCPTKVEPPANARDSPCFSFLFFLPRVFEGRRLELSELWMCRLKL